MRVRHWSEAATLVASEESGMANKDKGGRHSKKVAEKSLKDKRAARKAKQSQSSRQPLDKTFGH